MIVNIDGLQVPCFWDWFTSAWGIFGTFAAIALAALSQILPMRKD
jgi:hypothetical protein